MASGVEAAASAQSAATRRWVSVAARLGVSGCVLALIFALIPASQLLDALGRVPALTWLGIGVAFLALHALASQKWRMIVRGAGVDASRSEALRAHAAGLFANLCLPSLVGGDLVRAGLLLRVKGRAESVALASLADRLGDTAALAVIAGCAGLLVPESSATMAGKIIAFVAISLAVGVSGGIVLLQKLPADRLPARLAGIASRFRAALERLLAQPKLALQAFALSLSIQASFVALNLVLAQALGIALAPVVWFLAWPLAKLVALAPISLGGIGVREVAIAGLLAPFGVAAPDAVSQSLAWEVVLIAGGMVAGAAALLLGVRPGQHKREMEA